ncbi:mitochondrial transcription rescue factor 1 isoform X1 [Scleropages formosus]|uniref:Mitochondrial transcription rescue factor 1 n=2 Tax=Scleropages formosus TaxID=113540 RepID=A0A8C9QWG5_SCLFO|nr:uncharacterized protein C6orf203 homolog isoform X1 [Scleropages formosus]XP_018586240.1 uncharacterized protein C6orf203 homolog isoform X1 [Scleropages formosus]
MMRLWTSMRLVGRLAGPVPFQQMASAHIPPGTGATGRVMRTYLSWCPRPFSAAPEASIPPPGCTRVPARGKSSREGKKGSKKKTRMSREEDEDDEDPDPEASDEEEEPHEDPDLPRNYKDQERAVASLRYDLVIRAALDIPRNKIDDAFYQNRLRLNGQPLIKKSKTVLVGDTLDLVLEENEEAGTVTIMRVVVKAMVGETQNTGKHKVLLRRWKHLTLPKVQHGKS